MAGKKYIFSCGLLVGLAAGVFLPHFSYKKTLTANFLPHSWMDSSQIRVAGLKDIDSDVEAEYHRFLDSVTAHHFASDGELRSASKEDLLDTQIGISLEIASRHGRTSSESCIDSTLDSAASPSSFSFKGAPWSDSDRHVQAAALGLPSQHSVRYFDGYISSFNCERRIPNWVVEVLEGNRLKRGYVEKEESSPVSSGQKNNTTSLSVNPEESQVGQEKDFSPSAGEKILEKDRENEIEHQKESTLPWDEYENRQPSTFFADPSVRKAFQVVPKLYADSGAHGISRGHLASARSHKASQNERNSTYNMSFNIVPQEMTSNALDWYRLESFAVRLARDLQKKQPKKSEGKKEKSFADTEAKLYVASGPVFLPRKSKDGFLKMKYTFLEGKNPFYQMVAIPTHLFKVLVTEQRQSPSEKPRYTAAAFLLPNEPIPIEHPLTHYQVPISSLEFITGLHFFPLVNAASLPDLCSEFNCECKCSGVFTRKFRQVAQLRSATSVPELRSRFHDILEEHRTNGAGKNLESIMQKEYNMRLETLLASANEQVDSV